MMLADRARPLRPGEYGLIKDFLHMAVHAPGGSKPPRDIVDTEPRLRL
jgi:hypothetical protein